MAIFLGWVSPNWIHLPLAFCVLTYVSLFLAFFCPESPRWHLVNGRTDQAIIELNKFARMNKGEKIPADAVFVEDPKNLNREGEEEDGFSPLNLGNADGSKKDSSMMNSSGVGEGATSPMLGYHTPLRVGRG